MGSQEELIRRLRRVEGQVRGVQKMIEEGKPPSSILQQLAAITSAVHGAGVLVVSDQINSRLAEDTRLTADTLKIRRSELLDLLERIP